MPIEEDCTEALRTTLKTFERPNAATLLESCVRDGRRRRRRRVAAAALSGAAVLALVGTAAASVPGLLSDGRTADRTLPGPAASTTTGSASTTPKPTFTGTLPADRALATLTELLPTGLTHSSPPGGRQSGQLWVDDGRGKSLLEVHVSRQTSTASIRGHAFAGTSPSADGTLIASRQAPPGTDPGHAAVNVLHPDGLYVTIMQWQAPSQSAPSTRTTPILTPAQLRAIATSPRWQ